MILTLSIKKIVAIEGKPNHKSLLKTTSLEDIEFQEQSPLKGGFSGANVVSFSPVQNCRAVTSGALSPDKAYVIKAMDTKNAHRGMKEEIDAYICIEENFPLLKELYVKRVPLSDAPGVLVIEKASGPLLAEVLLNGDLSVEAYNERFHATTALFLQHFFENQMTPQRYYRQLEKTYRADSDIQAIHVISETIEKVINRIISFQENIIPVEDRRLLQEPTYRVGGKEWKNPLLFFLDLHPNKDRLIEEHFPDLKDTSPFFNTNECAGVIQLLKPRTLAPMPTDPSPTNETLGEGKRSGATWFDPGRIDAGCQLSYPLCKHEGPFAQLFMMLVMGKMTPNEDSLDLDISKKAWDILTEIHHHDAVYDRLNSCESGRALLQDKPFFLPVLFFFGWRQFGSDLVYRTNALDRRADLILFTLGMNYMADVFKSILRRIEDVYPRQPLETVLTNSDNFKQLIAISSESFTLCKTEHPFNYLSVKERSKQP